MERLARLLRFWFTFDSPVSRGDYLQHGLALMVLKYAVDTTLIWSVAGIVWTPWDYLTTGAAFQNSKLSLAPRPLLTLLAVWTLPFVWIGVSMSIRRALDAGRSAWLALLFFVPVVNYGLMAFLSVLPTSASRERPVIARPSEGKIPSALLSIAIGVGIDVGMAFVSVYGLREYGVSLFLGTPFVVGVICAYIFNRRYVASERETIELVLLTLAVTAGVMLLFGLEGVICLLMASPLAIGIGLLGALVGRAIARRDPSSPAYALIALVLLPPASPLLATNGGVVLHEVRSAIEVNAPPEAVWPRVIAFPALAEPSSFVRHIGIAYPQRARIAGSGVGAVRYCEFSTGAFVEPITAWEPGRRLSFDVVAEPPPLHELSPYTNLVPPHLDGYFRARRGEFRLIGLTENRTRLEGSTWYELRIFPEAYWSVFSDLIIRRIHRRVLEHIRNIVTEGERQKP